VVMVVAVAVAVVVTVAAVLISLSVVGLFVAVVIFKTKVSGRLRQGCLSNPKNSDVFLSNCLKTFSQSFSPLGGYIFIIVVDLYDLSVCYLLVAMENIAINFNLFLFL
jgi:hypothetical protein